MKLTGFAVFWLTDEEPHVSRFTSSGMSAALELMRFLREDDRNQFVSIASQHDDSVGKAGVDSVRDGKTPDGHEYEWSKKHRGAGPKPVTDS